MLFKIDVENKEFEVKLDGERDDDISMLWRFLWESLASIAITICDEEKDKVLPLYDHIIEEIKTHWAKIMTQKGIILEWTVRLKDLI
jgi:hypothetical protein